MTKFREGLPPLPHYMRHLPADHRGFPVPWFVTNHKENGEWDFQAVSIYRVRQAVSEHCCWLCGGKLFRNQAFVLGPMCVVNRTTAEPPCHCECAEYAVKACPFLTRPRMRRLPFDGEQHRDAPGMMIERNPGVAIVWVCRGFEMFRPQLGSPGVLFTVDEPIRVEAYCEGRAAIPEEVEASISSGLPSLYELADAEDKVIGNTDARDELERRIVIARKVLRLPEPVA